MVRIQNTIPVSEMDSRAETVLIDAGPTLLDAPTAVPVLERLTSPTPRDPSWGPPAADESCMIEVRPAAVEDARLGTPNDDVLPLRMTPEIRINLVTAWIVLRHFIRKQAGRSLTASPAALLSSTAITSLTPTAAGVSTVDRRDLVDDTDAAVGRLTDIGARSCMGCFNGGGASSPPERVRPAVTLNTLPDAPG